VQFCGLCRCGETRTQEIELAAAAHLTSDEFEFRDLAFCLAIRPRLCHRRGNHDLIGGDTLANGLR